MTTSAFEEVADYESQAREFLAKGREYLILGDLHQASEKGWGAAAHMAKAVAVAQGWEYEKHRDFVIVLNHARRLSGNSRLLDLRSRAATLHDNLYERKRHLDADIISEDLDSVGEMMELLAPLTSLGPEK